MEQLTQAVDLDQLFAKLCELEALVKALEKPVNEHSRELWGVKEIGKYFQCSETHAGRSICKSPYFPAPVAVVGRTGQNSRNLWVSGEVVKFALQRKKKKNAL